MPPPEAPAEAPTPELRCDLLVVGSGAGGLSVAVAAAHLGLKVVLVDAAERFGGTTAWSGGWLWVPRNPLAQRAGIAESLEPVRAYLRHVLGLGPEAALSDGIETFLAQAPQAIAWFEQHTALRFIDGNTVPDFHGLAPGAREGGRSVCAAPFDARVLGPELQRLQPPRGILSFAGMGIAGGADLRHFLRATRHLDSFAYVLRRLLRHGWDVLRHGRGTVLMGGNALAGALFKSALDAGVHCHERHALAGLLRGEGGRVVGAELHTPRGPRTVHAACGVVLACGGFPFDLARKAEHFPHAPTGQEHFSAGFTGNTGAGQRAAEAVGATFAPMAADAGAWAPVSRVPQPGGEAAAFPHLVERGKPGLMAVRANGQRFASEAQNYHSFMRALFAHGERRAWLVVDARFLRRYGLGHVKPWPVPHGAALRSGYLKRGRKLAELAQACGIDATGLQATVAAFNEGATRGEDPAFHRGATPYERAAGDAEHPGPNPCVAPMAQPPYYAVEVLAGSLGTFAGLRCSPQGQVLREDGRAIEGLYANGNERASLFEGHYPSGGITLGPALTLGYVLAHHVAGRPLPEPTP